jgi:hypothetical protein
MIKIKITKDMDAEKIAEMIGGILIMVNGNVAMISNYDEKKLKIFKSI